MDVSVIQKYVNVAYNLVKARDTGSRLANKDVEALVTKITSILFHQFCMGFAIDPVITILEGFSNTEQIEAFVEWYFNPAMTSPPGIAV